MEHMPLTRPQPFEEFPPPSGMDALFAEVTPVAVRMFEVTVTVPSGDGRRTVMDIVTWPGQAVEDFATVFRYAVQAEDFEVVVKPYEG